MRNGILDKDGGMRLTVMMHDLPLVIDDILYRHSRGNHLPRCTEMKELATRQRYDSDREFMQFRVINRGMCA